MSFGVIALGVSQASVFPGEAKGGTMVTLPQHFDAVFVITWSLCKLKDTDKPHVASIKWYCAL